MKYIIIIALLFSGCSSDEVDAYSFGESAIPNTVYTVHNIKESSALEVELDVRKIMCIKSGLHNDEDYCFGEVVCKTIVSHDPRTRRTPRWAYNADLCITKLKDFWLASDVLPSLFLETGLTCKNTRLVMSKDIWRETYETSIEFECKAATIRVTTMPEVDQ